METGDLDDMIRRLRSLFPRSWYPDDAPVLEGVLAGAASVAEHGYTLVDYARQQTRIATATDGWLDLIAYDFFGLRFRRRSGESDTAFRNRILPEILRPRGTRAAIVAALTELTGQAPYLVFEPWNPADTGGIGVSGRMGYNMAGRYGSLQYPNQMFVIAHRPAGVGIPRVSGLGEGAGGYGEGEIEYAGLADIDGPVTDQDIYAAIESVRPGGCIVWTAISPIPVEYFLDDAATLDTITLAP